MTMLKTGAAVATVLAAITMLATPSEARCRWCGPAAAGFVAGAAVGAIASNSYYGPGYGYGYGYGGPAYYGPGYAYYGGPAYDAYAYEPAYVPRRQSLPQYRDGTGHVAGTDALMDR